jgi:asparagine synthase (glutamine-hydrolysing)
MCGIVGYFGSRDVDLRRAAQTILHRGPDMQGITTGPGWTVAFNRLSIIDTSENGMQPFSFGGVSVVMNGEIYNYRELREEHKAEFICRTGSDVEILPFLYAKYGIQFLQKLNGMFAMVILDPRAGRYFLIRDRYGKKPLFYKHTNGGIYFASELKALRSLVTLRADRTNLALNMACWLLVQPLTPYEDVFSVNPGRYIEFDGRTAVERQWYEPQIDAAEQSYEAIREKFMALYRQSIAFRLRSDVPIGISLSGGLDSSSMAYLARAISPENFVAFTASIAGKEDREGSTDTENPKRLCLDLGIRQISTVVDFNFWNENIVDIARNYDEIFLNSGTLIFYAISAAAQSNGVKVLLSGVGGDELFGGYPWQSGMRALALRHLNAGMRRTSSAGAQCVQELWSRLGPGSMRARLGRAHRLFAQFHVWHAQSLFSTFAPFMADMDRKISARIESVSEGYFRASLRAVKGDAYNQVHYANIFTVIGNQNYQVDMASMRHSVENRSPMLDFNLVEYLMSVPDHVKNRSGPKSLMRKLLAEFLPTYITGARKSGPTMPLDQWYGDIRVGTSAKSFLTKNRELIGELVSADLAGRLQDDRLYAGQAGAMRKFALLSFVLWAKINLENSVPDAPVSFTELARANL